MKKVGKDAAAKERDPQLVRQIAAARQHAEDVEQSRRYTFRAARRPGV